MVGRKKLYIVGIVQAIPIFCALIYPSVQKHIVLGYLQKHKDFGMIVLSNNKGVNTYEFLDTY